MKINEILERHRARVEDAYNRHYDEYVAKLPHQPEGAASPWAIALWNEQDNLIDSLCVADHYIDCHGSESIYNGAPGRWW